jgi:uncharacterized protein involved in exopolysaccharide biosynthesis
MSERNQVVLKENSDAYTDEISVKEIVFKIIAWRKYLFSKWKVILSTVVIFAMVGLLYANHKKLYYIAKCTFVLQDGKSQMPGTLSGLSFLMGDSGGGGGSMFEGDNLLELYKSRLMLKKAILTPYKPENQTISLVDLYLNTSGLKQQWQKDASLSQLKLDSTTLVHSNRLQDSIIQQIVSDIGTNYLNVYKSKSGIITVEVKSTNEQFSKSFNDQVVKTVNDYYVQTVSQKALQDLKILQKQTDSIRHVMHYSLFSIASTIDANPNANLARRSLQVPSQTKQSDVEANKAVLSELVRNLELAKISLRKETPLIQLIDSPIYPLEKKRLSRLMATIAGGIAGGAMAVFFLSILLVYRKLLR